MDPAFQFDQDLEDLSLCSDRTHFIDNLRATLTVLLIVYHAIIECATSAYPHFASLPLTLFVATNRTFIWGLFFFISGYCSSVSRSSRRDGDFIWNKVIRLLVPGLAYGFLGHVVLWIFLSSTWEPVFGNILTNWKFVRFDGPVQYILALFTLDLGYVILSPSKSRWKPLPWLPRWKVKSKRQWYGVAAASMTILALCTFAIASSGREKLLFGYDPLHPYAPLQFILAYVSGIRLYSLQNVMLIPPPYALPALAASLTLPPSVLALSIKHSPALSEFVNLNTTSPVHPSFIKGGVNSHTLFYSIWSSLSFYMICASLVSVYAQCSWTRRDWGLLSRYTYLQTFLHMIPLVAILQYLSWVQSAMWKSALVALGTIVCSWGAMVLMVVLEVLGC